MKPRNICEEIRRDVLRMTRRQMALIMGCEPNDILTAERRRSRNHPYTKAFCVVLKAAPYEVTVRLLTAFLALRREPLLSDEDVEELKSLAKGLLPTEKYAAWHETLLRRLASRRDGVPYRDYSQNYVRKPTLFKMKSRDLALILGTDPSQVSKAENLERDHPYVVAFTLILRGCPWTTMRSLLSAQLCFRQGRVLTDAEVLRIKKIATQFFDKELGAYSVWETSFNSAHARRRDAVPHLGDALF